MRELDVNLITAEIETLFLEANYTIGQDIYTKIQASKENEASTIGVSVLDQLLANYDIAHQKKFAICQDSGMAIIFLKIGQEIHFTNGNLTDAINTGVKNAYSNGYLRKSIVDDPLYERKNTNTNTPAIIYSEIISGDKLEIEICAKGFGSENMSAIKMLSLSDGEAGVIDFVLDTIIKAGPNACPPLVVGIGIGGSFDKAAQLAKYATIRSVDHANPDERYAKLEAVLFNKINALGIGPAGLGGSTTVLGVNIEYYPTHIASLPVAINICCHAARHGQRII